MKQGIIFALSFRPIANLGALAIFACLLSSSDALAQQINHAPPLGRKRFGRRARPRRQSSRYSRSRSDRRRRQKASIRLGARHCCEPLARGPTAGMFPACDRRRKSFNLHGRFSAR